MEHLLFAAYLIFFSWLVTKTKFFTASGLTAPQLVILFLLKVMAGIFYGWIGVYYAQLAQMSDTWHYHYESLKEYSLLKSDPKLFFTSIFSNTYEDGYTKFLSVENSWWNDLKVAATVKLFAIFNFFSLGHYYINVIFYAFLTFVGPIALFRVMTDVFQANRFPILLASFLVPSVLFWTSGLHKDGLVLLGLSVVVYAVYFGLKQNRCGLFRLGAIFFGLLLVVVLRSFLILPLLPALIAWVLAHRQSGKALRVFGLVYLAFVVLFFSARLLHPRLDFPQDVADRQEAFLKLGGGSAVNVRRLEPTVGGFLTSAPQAFALSTIRPYPSDVRHLLSLAASVEINFLLLLFVLFLVWRRPAGPPNVFLLFCLFFAFSVLMLIGYSVNVLGAIVRYRSIVLSFLIVPLVAKTNWTRIGLYLTSNMLKK